MEIVTSMNEAFFKFKSILVKSKNIQKEVYEERLGY